MWTRFRLLASKPGSSATRLLSAGLVVMLALGSTGFVIGRGDKALHTLVSRGSAWLPTTQRGSVSMIDGQSGRSSVELQLNGASGHFLVVSQQGDQVLVLDTVTHKLMRVNVSQLTLGAAAGTSPGTEVVASLAATYLVNRTAGTVQRIDPVTLAPIGPQRHVPGRLGGTEVVDNTGTLWVPVDNGTAVPVTSAGVGRAVPVGAGNGIVLTSAAGVAIAVDPATRKITTLGSGGAGNVITVPASAAGGWQAVLVPATSQGGSLPVVSASGTPTLAIVNLKDGTASDITLGSEVTGHDLGSPVQTARQVFIPDYTTGSVLVYDMSGGGLGSTIPVTGHAGTFQAEVIDGIAYFNDPNGTTSVVVTPDGQWHDVPKTGPGVPTSRHGQPPGHVSAPRFPAPAVPQQPVSQPGTQQGGGASPGSHGGSTIPVPPVPVKHKQPPPNQPPPKQPPPKQPPPNQPPLPPLAPLNPQATPGTGYVDVSWQPPAGGGPVMHYQVSDNPAGGTQSTTGNTSVRFTRLTCGTPYSFTVSSVGAAGQLVGAAPVTAQLPCPPGAPAAPAATDHDAAGHGLDGAIQVTFTVPSSSSAQVTQVNYRLDSQGASGTWNGPFTAGGGTTETIGGLINGTSHVVYIQVVTSAGQSSPWSSPSNQVTPFGQPAAPTVSANANGRQVTFTWLGGGGNGRPVKSYNVCIDNSCSAKPGPGSVTNTYGYGQPHSVYATVIDSTGWSSPASPPSSVTTQPPPPPPPPTVSIADSGIQHNASQGTCSAAWCHSIEVTVSNFPPNVQLSYTCSASGNPFFGPSSGAFSGSTTTDGSGNAKFESFCIWGFGHNPSTATVTVTGGGKSATSNGIS